MPGLSTAKHPQAAAHRPTCGHQETLLQSVTSGWEVKKRHNLSVHEMRPGQVVTQKPESGLCAHARAGEDWALIYML